MTEPQTTAVLNQSYTNHNMHLYFTNHASSSMKYSKHSKHNIQQNKPKNNNKKL